MRLACTAGWLKDYHHLEPTVLKVIVGTLLLILHYPDVGNQDGTSHRPFFRIIARGDRVAFALTSRSPYMPLSLPFLHVKLSLTTAAWA
jgi:hypothetical protein